ncbi:carbamoyl-phosphate synthase large subunit [Dactylosporangium roseum]
MLVIGSGPIVIGQAAEFDYSGTQACRVLRAEGLRVILINSNPASIMTDPELADATYLEPLTFEFIERVIAVQRPDALLATMGGQTALNLAVALHDAGVLAAYGVRLIGAGVEAIRKGEDRRAFKEVVAAVRGRTGHGETARSVLCHRLEEALAAVDRLGGYPLVVRPSFTLGGAGSGMARDETELRRIAGQGFQLSPTSEVLLEESVLGWKEYELELMRDRADNVVVVCSIENVDPMGVHTGDSVTVAPAMTLTDREYQVLRDIGIAIIREVGVDSGGCNIQFAVNPADGRVIVVEMNPRVSRSSALASKATGYPIAKIATRLALGYTLDELRNEITGSTTACFEPALDYVAVKVPRFAFEKFAAADPVLTTTMKSVGEAMALGRNFTEALNKALRSVEQPGCRLDFAAAPGDRAECLAAARAPGEDRLNRALRALLAGASADEVHTATGIDPWFVDQLVLLTEVVDALARADRLDAGLLAAVKRHGLSDAQIAAVRGVSEEEVRGLRHALGVRPVYKTVDSSAGEFPARTPYFYSTYEEETEVAPRYRPAVIILGSGPNRIGQGIEFDYSCVHACYALGAAGYETVMVNCNPETVSTDYDTSDRLYLEPLTVEDVLEVVHAETLAGPIAGVVVQLGGQTPLMMAQTLKDNGVLVAGTQPEAIHLVEERGRFGALLADAGLLAPAYGTASSVAEAGRVAAGLGYPVMVRPSYVLGGRGMRVIHDEAALGHYLRGHTGLPGEHPVFIDQFLDGAVEIDVEALYDGRELYLGAVMEHIEEAGVHSGDSACVIPPLSLGAREVARLRAAAEAIAARVGVLGLLNIQFALLGDTLYVLEANARASRTVPFAAKATGVPLARAAARVCLGASIAELRGEGLLPARGEAGGADTGAVSVKEAVLPWTRFRDDRGRMVQTLLGPEMRATGEVIGLDETFGLAYAKAQIAAGAALPRKGRAFICVADRDRRAAILPARVLAQYGFELLATPSTAEMLRRSGIAAAPMPLHDDGGAPTAVPSIHGGQIDLVVSTAQGDGDHALRAAAITRAVPCLTTLPAFVAAVQAIGELRAASVVGVTSLQELFRGGRSRVDLTEDGHLD